MQLQGIKSFIINMQIKQQKKTAFATFLDHLYCLYLEMLSH